MTPLATRKEVAERAGVSPAVVSYVLNQSNYVSEEKTQAVLAAVRELDYTPNYMAKSLKANQSFNLALVCDDIRSELFAEITYYMEQYAYRSGYNVFLCNSRQDDQFLAMLTNRRMDGVFMATNIYCVDQLNRMAAHKVPIVFYKTREYPGLDQRLKTICVDYRDAARSMTLHLLEKGHRNIAYIPPYLSQIASLESEDYRLQGYCEAFAGQGLKPSRTFVCFKNHSYEAMLDFAARITALPAGRRPTAILAGNDYLAIQIINRLREMNLRVPEDVAVAGMDDTVSSVNASPQITTMSFSKKDIAQCVVTSLVNGRDHFDTSVENFGARLIQRGST